MMSESKLTSFQQRQLKETMRSGGSLPLNCNPTTSSPGRGTQKKGSSKTSRQPSVQGIRTKQTIEKRVDPEPEYRPTPSRKPIHRLFNLKLIVCVEQRYKYMYMLI